MADDPSGRDGEAVVGATVEAAEVPVDAGEAVVGATVEAAVVPVDAGAAVLELGPGERYDELDLLGEGGMGEVHACRDRIIGRVIARKSTRLRAGGRPLRTESLVQFLHEAQVQGQLEHPAVVPVYDVGRDANGRIYFTMKRLAGSTLATMLAALRAGDPETEGKLGRHRLLTAFQLVCRCIDYAHARGVVHRDLKPANIMFGDFGEVYVLDWGVARVGVTSHRPLDVSETPSGISGTPGYMAPEQLAEVAPVDGRMDVYALGAILFELLTLEPLHAGDDTRALVDSTRKGAEARASVRFPAREVPPELEAICVRATALSPVERYATVRELSEDVERFLEGHRDLELRRTIAARHVAEARRQADIALRGEGEAAAARSRALGEIGRALALRPDEPEATDVLRQLLSTPPRALPAAAAAAIEAQESEEGRAASRLAGWVFAVMAAGALLVSQLVTLTDMGVFAVFVGASLLASIIGFANRNRPSDLSGVAIVALAGVAMAATSAFLGPLVLTPILAVALAIISMNVGRLSRYRPVSLAIACMVVAVPAALELTGVIPSSYVNLEGSWLIRSKMALAPSNRAYPMGLLMGSIVAIIGSSLFVWRMGDRIAELRRDLHLHAWHLSQLVPEEARPSAGDARSIPPPA